MKPRHHHLAACPVIALAVLALAACGDDEDDASTTRPAATQTAATEPAVADADAVDPALTEYCAVAAELNSQDALPSADQLDRYAELAPSEIEDTVTTVVDAFATADGDPSKIFSDPATVAAIEELTAFEAEACGFEPPQDPGAAELDPAATRVGVVASDHRFDLTVPTEPGPYSFVMVNEGAEPHLMVLLQLEPDATLDEVMASEGESGVIASFESNVAAPGMEAVVTAELESGRWVLVCPIPNADGTPHVALGMAAEFVIE